MSLGKTADQRIRNTTQRNHGVYNPGKNGLAGHSENNAARLVLRDAGTPASLEQPETLGPVIPHSSEDSGDGTPWEVKSHGAKEVVHGRAAIVFRRIVGELYDDFATLPGRQSHLLSARGNIGAIRECDLTIFRLFDADRAPGLQPLRECLG